MACTRVFTAAPRVAQVTAKPKDASLPMRTWTELDDTSLTAQPIYLPEGGIGNLT